MDSDKVVTHAMGEALLQVWEAGRYTQVIFRDGRIEALDFDTCKPGSFPAT